MKLCLKELFQNKKYAKLAIIALLVLTLTAIYLRHSKNYELMQTAVAIETAVAISKEVPIYISALGTVTPEYSATIKTQINGQVLKVNFEDGQAVKKGDILAEIDSSSYKAQVEQYQGQLLRDQALLDNAKLDLARYQELWKQNSISKQTLDTQTSLVKQYEGTVQLDQGLLDAAKANLNYCTITAPFDGQMGLKQITEGNIIQTTDVNGIGTINMVNPISVVFAVPEVNISEILTQNYKELEVEAYNQTQTELLARGTLSALDNQIDITTGTLKLKAEFDNKDKKLFSNQFVNIKLQIKKIKDAITIPSSALQYGPNNNFVYLIENEKAKVTPVIIETSSNHDVVIKSGLSKDQVVAISGTDKLVDGSPVFISENNNN